MITVHEEYCGIDNKLIFPNIQTCVAVILRLKNQNISGFHATLKTSAKQIEVAAKWIKETEKTGVDAIFLVGNLSGRTLLASPGLPHPEKFARHLKRTFKCPSLIKFFDVCDIAKFDDGDRGSAVIADRTSSDSTLKISMLYPSGWKKGPTLPAGDRLIWIDRDDSANRVLPGNKKGGGKVYVVQETATPTPVPLHLMATC